MIKAQRGEVCFPKSHCTLCFNTGITERQRKDYPGRPGSPPSCRNPGVPGLLICHLSSLESAFLKKKKTCSPSLHSHSSAPPHPFLPGPSPKREKWRENGSLKIHISITIIYILMCVCGSASVNQVDTALESQKERGSPKLE